MSYCLEHACNGIIFGSGHDKGRWDGAGISIKQTLKSEHVKPIGVRLDNVYDVLNFLQGHF
jgi:hypothetical protein